MIEKPIALPELAADPERELQLALSEYRLAARLEVGAREEWYYRQRLTAQAHRRLDRAIEAAEQAKSREEL